MGASHAVQWSESSFCVFQQVVQSFFVTNAKKRGIYQSLGATLKRWLTPIGWLTPGQNVIFST